MNQKVLIATLIIVLIMASASLIPFSEKTDVQSVDVSTATSVSTEEWDKEEAKSEDIQGAQVRDSVGFEDFSGDLIFQTADLHMVDVSLVQNSIEGVRLNRYSVVEVRADELRKAIQESQRNGQIALKLFEDLTVVGTVVAMNEYHEGERAGRINLRGNVKDEDGSSLSVIVSPDGTTTIQISGSVGSYRLSRLGGTKHHIILDYPPPKLLL